MRPQGYSLYFGVNMDEQICSCALGAAYEAITGRIAANSLEVNEKFLFSGYELDKYLLHPETLLIDNLHHIITNLNDEYKWTREQIADWVESLGY